MWIGANTTEDVTTRLELAREPAGWLGLAFLALLAAAVWFIYFVYQREGRIGASRGLRFSLATVRLLVILLLAYVWLDPVIATYIRRVTLARLLVLVDDSASMSLVEPPDREADAGAAARSRTSQVTDLLNSTAAAAPAGGPRTWLERLAARNRVHVYTFGSQTSSTSQPASAPTGSQVPDGAVFVPVLTAAAARTDLGSALQAALTDAGDSPLAGIVVITDGQVNSGLRGEALLDAAVAAHTPIYSIGVGGEREPLNFAVSDLAAPEVAARGDPAELTAHVHATGLEAETSVQVELVATRLALDSASAPDAERIVGQQRVVLSPEKTDADVPFRVTIEEAGRFAYTARVVIGVEDRVPTDNQRLATVQVLDERLRVLVVSGRPSYEYRGLVRLLARDKALDTSFWLQSADPQAVRDGTTTILELPRKPEDLFAYDVILLLDPNPVEFDSAWCLTARRFIDDLGGGLLYQAGPAYSPRFLRDARLEDLLTLLPVTPDPDAELRVNERGSFQTNAAPLAVTERAATHPLVSMGGAPDAARNAWTHLPGVWWFMPVQRAKPLAEVLLRLGAPEKPPEDGQVLLASQPFGGGRVVFMAYDGTWRWRSTAESLYNRYWVQMVRYLGQTRRQGQNKRGVIVPDHESAHVGDAVRVEARILDDAFAPLSATRVTGRLTQGGGAEEAVELDAIPGREGWFAGRAFMTAPGPARLVIPLESSITTTPPAALSRQWIVRDNELEFRTLRQDVEFLRQLATATGGTYHPLSQAGDLPEHIEDARRITTPRQPNPRALWDRGWLLLGVVGLLCLEWTLRRRNHLL